jgi:hypothetical protein
MPTFVFFDMSIVYCRRRLRLWAVTRTPDGIGMIGIKTRSPIIFLFGSNLDRH